MLYFKLKGVDKAVLAILKEEADIYTLSIAKQVAVKIQQDLPNQIDLHRSRRLKNRTAGTKGALGKSVRYTISRSKSGQYTINLNIGGSLPYARVYELGIPRDIYAKRQVRNGKSRKGIMYFPDEGKGGGKTVVIGGRRMVLTSHVRTRGTGVVQETYRSALADVLGAL
jgi:hypothetical protein